MSEKTNDEQLFEMLKSYTRNSSSKELEVRFGINTSYNPLTRENFENIISKFESYGFKQIRSDGEYHLNINSEYIDSKTGFKKLSNLRTQIYGFNNIQRYCKKNSFDIENVPNHITFLKKTRIKHDTTIGEFYNPIIYNDFEFRINYKNEDELEKNDRFVRILLESWNDSKKIFRFIKRYTLTHPRYPFKIDCSIVKTSKQRKNAKGNYWMVPQYNIKDSGVFENIEHFEIELELINLNNKSDFGNDLISKFQIIYSDKSVKYLRQVVKKGIKMIMSGIQESNYPISYKEQSDILKEYIELTYDDKKKKIKKEELLEDRTEYRRQNRKNFIGPSSISLELKHIIDSDEQINILKNYTVTDKADGTRKLLYISKTGKIYLFDINLKVIFTGCIVKNKKLFETIIDGEYVMNDKNGVYINKFLAFDIYIANKEDYRSYPMIPIPDMKYKKQVDKNKFRLKMLEAIITVLKMENGIQSIVKSKPAPMKVEIKKFYNNLNKNIFSQCDEILNKQSDKIFEYEIDGLIFTPIDKSVGSDEIGEHSKQSTWVHSFKWKPPEFNTIDFLITTKKDGKGYDLIGNLFQDGVNTTKLDSIVQYKTIILRVGFSQKNHGFLNPQENIIQNVFPKREPYYNDYKPAPFYPTDPTPNYDIHICKIPLSIIGNKKLMMTEDKKQTFENDMIVEFRFDPNAEPNWQWIPIRVRYDKTYAYRKGKNNFGNDYKTANSVWKSINNPITKEMITTGDNIPTHIDTEMIYYKKKHKKTTTTRGLRDFHNKYVKHKLIKQVSNKGDYLMDMTVGKAGDLYKWIDSDLSVVVGLDNSKDNIENQLDGACTRYIKQKQTKKNIPRAMFLHADSKLNMVNGKAFYDEKSRQIMNAIYGKGVKDSDKIGEGIYNLYGSGKEGFDIVSNQFSIHYFFENIDTLLGFIQNVSENCKKNGYFIGTCYDGKKIFKLLKNTQIKKSIVKTDDDKITWSIKKKYNKNEMKDNKTSLGYKIDIFQESINQSISEYLVNFDYLTELLENFGFVPCPSKDLQKMHFKNAIGSFEELFDEMEENIKLERIKKHYIGDALTMTNNEKEVSFLNNYFIYKKIRNVNSEKMVNILKERKEEVEKLENEVTEEIVDKILNESKKIRREAIKYKKKITLPSK
jgi:hypothetical protein